MPKVKSICVEKANQCFTEQREEQGLKKIKFKLGNKIPNFG